ncbi:MAG: alpha/beta hydrolase [Pseudomonadota bacterium]
MKWTRLAAISLTVGAVATVAFGAVTLRVADARARAAEAQYPPSGEFVDVGGRRVHAQIMGSGPDLVLIHGAFGSLQDFTYDLMPRLAERYRVIAFDRPGLGYTDRTDPAYARTFARDGESPAEQATLLADAARKLGAEKPIVAGHSFGGIVAMAWALDQDPAAVVMLAGVAMPWPGDLGWIYQVNGTRLGGAFVPPLLSAYAPQSRLDSAVQATFEPQSMPEGYDTHIGPYMPLRLEAFRANARQVNHLRPHVVEMSARYPDLTLPIEIVHGDMDDTVPLTVHSGPMSDLIASASLTVLEGVGHMPHHANPEAVIAAIDRAAERAGLR